MHAHAFFKVCLVLIFLNTIVEKTYPEPWIYSFCINFMLKKSCLKFPKSATWILGLKMTPPPLALFKKFIRFDSGILPISALSASTSTRRDRRCGGRVCALVNKVGDGGTMALPLGGGGGTRGTSLCLCCSRARPPPNKQQLQRPVTETVNNRLAEIKWYCG